MMKLCKDCKFCKLSTKPELSRCLHPKTIAKDEISMVDGNRILMFKSMEKGSMNEWEVFCASMRSTWALCTPDAVLFEQAEFKETVNYG